MPPLFLYTFSFITYNILDTDTINYLKFIDIYYTEEAIYINKIAICVLSKYILKIFEMTRYRHLFLLQTYR